MKFLHDADGGLSGVRILVVENGGAVFKQYAAGDFPEFNSLARKILNDAENLGWLGSLRDWVQNTIPSDTWDDLSTEDVAKTAKAMMRT